MRHNSFPQLPNTAKEERPCYKLPDGREVNVFVTKEIELEGNHYTLVLDDSNDYLVFNKDSDIVLHVPDNLPKGYGAIATNIGTGSIQVVMDAVESLRGWHTLTDPDSFITLIKITDRLWQSSERR